MRIEIHVAEELGVVLVRRNSENLFPLDTVSVRPNEVAGTDDKNTYRLNRQTGRLVVYPTLQQDGSHPIGFVGECAKIEGQKF